MTRKNVLVLISGNGSNLQAIIDSDAVKNAGGDICAVISNSASAYGLVRAEKSGIDHKLVESKNFTSRLDFDRVLIGEINRYSPDLIVLAGFMRILTPEFVQQFHGKLLNIHPSLLPKYPGLNTHQKAIDNSDQHHGVSVHFVTEELDGGPVIAQSRFELSQTDTLETVLNKIRKLEHKIYPHVIELFLKDKIKLVKGKIEFDYQTLDKPIIV